MPIALYADQRRSLAPLLDIASGDIGVQVNPPRTPLLPEQLADVRIGIGIYGDRDFLSNRANSSIRNAQTAAMRGTLRSARWPTSHVSLTGSSAMDGRSAAV